MIKEQHRMQMEQLKSSEDLSVQQQDIIEEWFNTFAVD